MSLIDYEKLDVYRLAYDQAVILHELSQPFPKNEQFGGIADQIRRSSRSICANLAEGLSKQMSIPDKRRFIQMAMGSAEETRVWLSFCGSFGYVPSEDVEELKANYLRITQMLYQLQKRLKF